MDEVRHRCDGSCRCPVHSTPLIYWPAGDDHACQDVDCEYGSGFKPVQAPPPGQATLDTQAVLMLRYHPDLKNVGHPG